MTFELVIRKNYPDAHAFCKLYYELFVLCNFYSDSLFIIQREYNFTY